MSKPLTDTLSASLPLGLPSVVLNRLKRLPTLRLLKFVPFAKKMFEIMTQEASSVDLKGLFLKFAPEVIGLAITKACHSIFPLQNVYIRKCKILKAPKVDYTKLMELHGEAGGDDSGNKVARGEFKEPEILSSV
ncbi:ribosomal 40S subunit protein S1B [Entomophthora muscae]|uniref:Ribosomal 40S subunit protein S1B n=1 Tax=Entomophthora muscae TaxID=34485 RepID=A0ACC2SC15_9FUNG|nr:ribosomal 40S subunit protein S1B [Entomophthora muscae]